MAYEVEMKAWIDDWDAVERYLRDRCVFERSFRKEDRYFELGTKLFRVRMDDSTACVTFKEKSISDGMELNTEREFGVDDADAFVDLMRRLGCEEVFAKTKEGLHFVSDGLTVELVHVEELGNFLEVECVHDEDRHERHAEAARRVRSFLAAAGIAPERVESRSYMFLLREARSGDGDRAGGERGARL